LSEIKAIDIINEAIAIIVNVITGNLATVHPQIID